MLQERVSDPQTMDALITSAGFRMGPFTLMDLIGMDINLSVSETVFKEMYYDARYRPSLIQKEMVVANLLGKKSGQGFYKYDGSANPLATFEGLVDASQLPVLHGILKTLQSNGMNEIEGCAILLSNGETCNQRLKSISQQHLAQVDLMLDFESCPFIHVSFDAQCPAEIKNTIIGVFQQLDKKVIVAKDLPALIVMRTVCLLINEAADAIENGVCNEIDVDLAMQKGVNYPIGLIAWAHKLGIQHVVDTLDNLHQWFGDDKYRVSPWLRKNC